MRMGQEFECVRQRLAPGFNNWTSWSPQGRCLWSDLFKQGAITTGCPTMRPERRVFPQQLHNSPASGFCYGTAVIRHRRVLTIRNCVPKNNEMGGACGTCGWEARYIQCFGGESERKICALLGYYAASCGNCLPTRTLDPWRWDRYVVTKRR
jgi:hypothetical protein